MAAPSPLLLFLFKFVAVSIGISDVSVVMGAGEVEICLFLAFFLALVTGGCSVMCAGMGAVTDLYIYAVVGVVIFVEAGSMSFTGEAVDLSSAFWGDFFFFPGDFYPLYHCLRLGLVWLLSSCCLTDGGCGNCCCYGFCGDCGSCSSWNSWRILFRAEL